MFASAVQTTMLWSARTWGLIRADSEPDASFWSALPIVVLLCGVLWLLVKLMPPEAHSLGGQPKAAKAKLEDVQVLDVRRAPGARARVIRLHAVTPGQSEHDYNLGDQSGTRGSRLSRTS